MKRLIAALALTPALMAPGAFAQTIPDEVSKQLWCGTAMVLFFSSLPPDLTEAEKAEAAGYVEGGRALLEIAVQGHLDAGMAQADVDTLKGELEQTVIQQIQSGTATYSFDDCLAITPGLESQESSEPSSSPSSAM